MAHIFGSSFGTKHQCFVYTTKPTYYSGEVVEGNITFNVVAQVAIQGVDLYIKGVEESRFQTRRTVTQTNGQGNTYTETVIDNHYAKRAFFRRRVTLFSSTVAMSPGVYVYPFTFVLDAGLPGTFNLSGSHAGLPFSARVVYKVKAVVDLPGIFTRNIKHKQEFTVREPLQKMIQSVDTKHTGKVRLLCCIPKGQVTLSANFNQDAFPPGGVLQVNMVADATQTTMNMRGLVVVLKRELILSSGTSSIRDVQTVAKAHTEPFQAGTVETKDVTLPLPPAMEPSTAANLVKCRYWMEARMDIPWSPDISITHPVTIYANPPVTYVVLPPPPPAYTPTTYPVFQATNFQTY